MRIEHDLIGELAIDSDAYCGIHTVRAVENFPLTNRPVNRRIINALALVKKACVLANSDLGLLPKDKALAIIQASDEIAAGDLDHFPVDALSGGAGTSVNMNVNEVIANRAIELLGGTRGEYERIHPIEDVNLNQSTNDVFPTAVKIAAIYALREASSAIAATQGALQKKENEFESILTIGRTELTDAVPMTLGMIFAGYAEAFSRDRWRTFKCEERLRTVNLGGTSVGTGLAAPQAYIFRVIEKLREVTGLGLSRAETLTDATSNADIFVEVSGMLKAHAANLLKILNDIRLMRYAGEIVLPAVQAGSSAMPGKVNPVILESVMQAAMAAAAHDAVIFHAASRGTFQINEFMPLIADSLLGMLDLIITANRMLAPHLAALTGDSTVAQERFNRSEALITAFVPRIGYERATALVKEFRATHHTTMRQFLADEFGDALVDDVLSASKLSSLGYK